MAKNSVSEWSTVSSGNGDIAGLTLGLDMPPSYVNNAMQEMMAQIKQWKDGYTDPITGLPVYQSITVENIDIEGIANFKVGLVLNGSYGDDGQVLVSQGVSATPTWGDAFVTGMIMLWSGSTASVPSGWALCNGTSGTPNLMDKMIMGAGNAYNPDDTGGSANAVLVSHNHTLSGSTNATGAHVHSMILSGLKQPEPRAGAQITAGNDGYQQSGTGGNYLSTAGNHAHSISGTTNTTGASATNANIPPYYALAYIMKL